MTSFGHRLRAALDAHGPLCLGIDPHLALLSEWGLDATAAGVREFGLRAVDAAAGRAGIVKPQVSFFERFGSAGFAALEDVLAASRAAGLVTIADAKRGDIGTTMEGYADAWLAAGSALEADAVTVSPYLGPDSLRDTLAAAVRADKGVFVLAATSNPEAAAVQTALTVDVASADGQTVAQRVARDATWPNRSAAFDDGLGPIGLVIGATVDRAECGLADELLAHTPILAPGFGAQGAQPSDLRSVFGALAPNVIASESRSLLSAGPDRLADAITARADEYRSVRG
ncbi:MAG: orotidine-5'-phosphate decarboxylase [Microbacterium sp.]|uniref:orotidine-5'-phosphate decarboxylase n=1 Tax=Microbacterium sp. TaxID=51671 RepID=UPI0039E57665